MSDGSSHSELACPVCGAYRLAIALPPYVAIMGVQPYSDLLGMGDPKPDALPGIECLACGSRWRDINAFRDGETEPAAAPAHEEVE